MIIIIVSKWCCVDRILPTPNENVLLYVRNIYNGEISDYGDIRFGYYTPADSTRPALWHTAEGDVYGTERVYWWLPLPTEPITVHARIIPKEVYDGT